MLKRVQRGKCSFGRGVVRERRDVTDSARGKGVVMERRDVTDSVRGKGIFRDIRDVTDIARGKGSVGRDVLFQTVQG